MKFLLAFLLFSLVYGNPIRNETSNLDAKNKRKITNTLIDSDVGSIETFKVVAGAPGVVDDTFKTVNGILSETIHDIVDSPVPSSNGQTMQTGPSSQNSVPVQQSGTAQQNAPIQQSAPVQQSPQVQQNDPSQTASNPNINQNSASVNSNFSPLSPLSVASFFQATVNNPTNTQSDNAQASNTNVNSVQVDTNSNPSNLQSNINNAQVNEGNIQQGVLISQTHPKPQSPNFQLSSLLDILQSSNPFGPNFPFNTNFNPLIINGNLDSFQLSSILNRNSKPNSFNPTIINGL